MNAPAPGYDWERLRLIVNQLARDAAALLDVLPAGGGRGPDFSEALAALGESIGNYATFWTVPQVLPEHGQVRAGVVALLADADALLSDRSVWPWKLVHMGTHEPFSAAETAVIATANMDEVRAALQMNEAAKSVVARKQADLLRLDELLAPHMADLYDSPDAALARMPEGGEKAEAAALLAKYPELREGGQ